MKALPQALDIIFEVQMKRNNEKITRNKKKAFSTYKMHLFLFFLLFKPLLLSNLIAFLFFIHFK
jgi:hypothetical protein